MKFSGHILELHFFSSLSISLPVTHTRAYTHCPFLLLFSMLLPLPFLLLCECSLTHTAVGCVGGHYMPLLLSLFLSLSLSLVPSLTTSFSLPHSLLLSHSSCLKPGLTFSLPECRKEGETKREAIEKPYSLWMRGSKKEETLFIVRLA